MAAGGGVPELGGYNHEFLSEVPGRLKCSICLSTLKDPMQVKKCGHRFCKLCIDPILNRPPARCPTDRQPISRDKVFQDAACEREVLNLRVKCPFQSCPWAGELRGVESHATTCQFKLVDCTNESCDEKVTRRDLDRHVTSECQWRIVHCPYCRESFICKFSQRHKDVCERQPLSCLNECGKSDISKEEMDAHIKDVCPRTIIPCKYGYLNCKEKIRRGALQDHIKEGLETHLDLVCLKLKQVELECAKLKESEWQLSDKVRQLELECSKHKESELQILNRLKPIESSSHSHHFRPDFFNFIINFMIVMIILNFIIIIRK